MLFLAIIASLVALVKGHGCITKITGNGQTACGVNVEDPEGCTGTAGLTVRDLIARSGNNGVCSTSSDPFSSSRQEKPPGCVATFNCDWCALEKVVENSALPNLGSKWWSRMPAAHWDNPNVHPKFPCMTKKKFGDKGKMKLRVGDSITTRFYVNADHSGLYQFQIACGNVEENSKFKAITPWKALHRNKEGTELGESRIVGYTKQETDGFFAKTTCTGAGCPLRMNRGINPSNSGFCKDQKPEECIVQDIFPIPSNFACTGDAILRWAWNSAEGPETYANCLDLELSSANTPVTQAPTSSNTPKTQAPSSVPTKVKTCNCQRGTPVSSSDCLGDGINQCASCNDEQTPVDGQCPATQAPCPTKNCISTPNCCPQGQKCFKKDAYWADCRATCIKGVHSDDPPNYQTPWECTELGVGAYEEYPNSGASILSGTLISSVLFLLSIIGYIFAPHN